MMAEKGGEQQPTPQRLLGAPQLFGSPHKEAELEAQFVTGGEDVKLFLTRIHRVLLFPLNSVTAMSRKSATYAADHRLKELRRMADATSTETAQTIQDRNSWFVKPTKKRILNASEVARYLMQNEQ